MYISMWVELLIFKKVGGYPTHNIYIYSLSRNTRRNLNIFLEKYRRQKNESLTTLIADPAHLSIIKFPNMENGWTFFFSNFHQSKRGWKELNVFCLSKLRPRCVSSSRFHSIKNISDWPVWATGQDYLCPVSLTTDYRMTPIDDANGMRCTRGSKHFQKQNKNQKYRGDIYKVYMYIHTHTRIYV